MGVGSNCGTTAPGCSGVGSTHGVEPTGIDPACHYVVDGSHGLDCIYCVPLEDQTDCSIEQDRCTPCGTGASLGRHFLPVGARIVPFNRGPTNRSDDVFRNVSEFVAGDGGGPTVKYYLKSFTGMVDPVHPDPTFNGNDPGGGDCCTWLCSWMTHNDGLRAWTLFCHEVPQARWPNLPNLRDLIDFAFIRGNKILYVHFNFANLGDSCFQLRDQFCFTAGTPDVVPPNVDFWAHMDNADSHLIELDSLRVSLNLRFATDRARYRYKEPECATIADDALSGLRTFSQLREVYRPSGTRFIKYDNPLLNEWNFEERWTDCATAPAVKRNGGSGAAWTVYVVPHGTDCRFPADLVYRRVVLTLSLSVERAFLGWPRVRTPGIRAAATFEAFVEMRVRLRPGWESIDCAVRPQFTPCGADFVDPAKNLILISDGCGTVPLTLRWRGMQGPRPWSRGPFTFQTPRSEARCCDALAVIDGLVIPGEVNDIAHPDGSQVFGGDVVIGLKTTLSGLGC